MRVQDFFLKCVYMNKHIYTHTQIISSSIFDTSFGPHLLIKNIGRGVP